MMGRNAEETLPAPEGIPPQPGPGPAPLLVPLLAFAAGILTVRLGVGIGSPLAALPLLAAALTARSVIRIEGPRAAAGGLLGALLMALAGAGWATVHLPLPVRPDLAFRELPARAFTGNVAVERIWRQPDAYGRVTGLARVVSPAERPEERAGERLYIALDIPASRAAAIHRSAVWTVTGILQPLNPPNLGTADAFLHSLRARGVGWTLSRGRWLEEYQPPRAGEQALVAARGRIDRALARGSNPESRAILQALVLGDRTALSDRQAGQFKDTGTLHFFAVSGLHVGLLAGALITGFRLAGIARTWQGWLMLPVCGFYVGLAGMTVSAQRAFLMLVVWVLAEACLRQPRPLPAWALAAWIALLLDPHAVGDAGFLLSFGVVAALLVYGVPWARTLEAWVAWPWRWVPEADRSPPVRLAVTLGRVVGGAAAISLAAWLASSPVIMTAFGRMTPWALVLNVPLVLLVGVALPLGLLGAGLAAAGLTGAAQIPWWLAEPLLRLMDDLTARVGDWTGSVIATPGLPDWFPWLAWLGLFALPLVLVKQRAWSWSAGRWAGAGATALLLAGAPWLS